MRFFSSVSDRLLELVVPRATAAAEDCQIIGCCDDQYVRYMCTSEHGGSVRCIYAFGQCRTGGGGTPTP